MTASPQILIVDDDLTVMESVVDVLISTGYAAVGVTSGPDGVEMLKAHRDSITIVLVDYNMPIWNGLETIGELRKVIPGLHCVLATGESQPPKVPNPGVAPNSFLQKPFTFIHLMAAIEKGLAPPTE